MSIRWDSESDWKSNQDSSGTTGRNGELKQGYSRDKPDLSNGLIGYWPLHDESATDYSGNGNHGTLNGGVTTGVAGKGGLQAMSFDGNDGEVVCPHSGIVGESKLTVSFWIKVDGHSSPNPIVSQWYSSAYQNSQKVFIIKSTESGSIQATIHDSGGGQNFSEYTSTESVPLDEWCHVAFTFNAVEKRPQLYLNGVQLDYNTREYEGGFDTSAIGSSETELYVGSRKGSSNHTDGKISDVRVYDRICSAEEIQTLYEWGSSDQASPPTDGIARYPLNTVNKSTEQTIDSVADGDVSEYSEQTGNPVSGDGLNAQKSVFKEEEHAIKSNINDYTLLWTSTGGLQYYPSAGDTIRAFYRAQAEKSRSGFMWFTDSAGNDGYRLSFRYADGETRLQELNSGTTLDSTTTLPAAGEWHNIEIQTTSGGGFIGITVKDSTGNTVLTLSGNSSAETSGGIGFYQSSANKDNTFYWDNIRAYENTSMEDKWGSNDGTNNGATFTNNAIRGQSASFDGSSYINTGITDLWAQSEFSLTFWFKNNTVSSERDWLFGAYDTSTIVGHGATVRDDEFRFYCEDEDDQGLLVENTSDAVLSTGVWNHAAVVLSEDGTKLQLYINGILADTDTNSNYNRTSTFSYPMFLGTRNTDGGTYRSFDGHIDDVRIYDYALTPSEVFELYRWGTKGRDMRKQLVNH